MTTEPTFAARFARAEGARVICTVCPRECRLAEGQHGYCYVRQNVGGRLALLAYGRPQAVAVDPIEKKPLSHFLPGTLTLSMGTVGCNLGCRCCQNQDLSRARSLQRGAMLLAPERVPRLAEQEGCVSVAFTYNEPSIYPEYLIDASRACHEQGIATVAVTSGYIQGAARAEMYASLDAANIDLKAFTDRCYRSLTGAHLAPVLDTIGHAVRAGVWVELTTLLIPGENDGDEELGALARWVATEAGRDVPLHLSAFHPAYRMLDHPRTPLSTLHHAASIAKGEGLRYVYTGNVHDPEGACTRCPGCGRALIERSGFAVVRNDLVGTDRCPGCGQRIAGVFDDRARARSAGQRYSLK